MMVPLPEVHSGGNLTSGHQVGMTVAEIQQVIGMARPDRDPNG